MTFAFESIYVFGPRTLIGPHSEPLCLSGTPSILITCRAVTYRMPDVGGSYDI